jgi:hypothetical protein
MNEQKIHELLQRYFNGATSLSEESELQRYFAEGDIHDSLKAYQPMFVFFAEERTVEPPVRKPTARYINLSWVAITSIAASIAILLLVGLPKTQDHYIYYVDGQRVYDQATALESAESSLQMLAASMQKARSSMTALETVQEGNKPLQQLSKIANAYRQAEEAGFKLQEAMVTNN